tara:strand:- start:17 stop:493 length:477 start_codon:yes stop_codon:yes gene_type:complete
MEKLEKQYYTPTIEEFYVGFEYEKLILDTWTKSKVTWGNGYSDDTTTRPININTIGNFLENGKNSIRVKFLDREDVKDCNWIKFNLDGVECYTKIYKGRCWYLWYNDLPFISINEGLVGNKYKDTFQIYKGECLNKSELRYIEKKLKIKNEINQPNNQ